MTRSWQLLSEWQRSVLAWVAAGCPSAGEAEDNRRKASASALADRGLVQVSRRGGVWTALVTDSAHYYLEHGHYQSQPGNVRSAGQPASATGGAPRRTRRELPPARRPVLPVLVGEPVGGSRRSRRHAAVVYLDEHREQLGVTRAMRPRALRLVQRLAEQAEARGWQVDPVVTTGDHSAYGHESAKRNGHVVITIGPDAYRLKVVQETDPREHVPTAKELSAKARHPWMRIPPFDAIPADRLRLELVDTYGGRLKWADGKRALVEEKLDNLLDALAARAATDVARRHEHEQAALARQRRWEAAMARARVDYIEAQRRDVLLGEVRRWDEARGIRQYCEALRARSDGADGAAWTALAEAYADRIDPLRGPVHGVPEVPEPRATDLQPYLRGFSPFGPPE